MNIFEIIGAVGVICSIFFSSIAFLNSKKKEIKQLGISEKNITNLASEVEALKKDNEELRAQVSQNLATLNKKIDTEVKELKKIIDKNNESSNNNFMTITKILATLQAKMEIIEKKL